MSTPRQYTKQEMFALIAYLRGENVAKIFFELTNENLKEGPFEGVSTFIWALSPQGASFWDILNKDIRNITDTGLSCAIKSNYGYAYEFFHSVDYGPKESPTNPSKSPPKYGNISTGMENYEQRRARKKEEEKILRKNEEVKELRKKALEMRDKAQARIKEAIKNIEEDFKIIEKDDNNPIF